MLPDFLALKTFFKIDSIKNDTNVFRFHYKLTVIFLVTFATIVSLNQFVGDPIDCFVEGNEYLSNHYLGKTALDNYCWIHSTFTLPNQPGVKYNNKMSIPGLGTPKDNETIIHHKYYQWVGFFLMFQAICFYIPRLIWKMREAGKLRALCEDLKSVLLPSEIEKEGRKSLSDYIFANLNQHQFYAASFFVCELLTLINVIGQIFLIDAFLGGEFTAYGINVVQQSGMDPEERMDPMSMIFPKVSKCIFKSYGPSGTIQIYDAFCVLPVNIINEKIFIFLWFWFIILSTMTAAWCLVRVFTLTLPKFRLYLLQKKVGLGVSKERTTLIFKRCQIGDWFLIMLIGENVSQWVFDEVLDDLAERFEDKSI